MSEPIVTGTSGAAASGDSRPGDKQPDYIQKIRTDPDFAEREVRNLKSRFDTEAAAKTRILNQLGRLREPFETGQLHGDDVATKYNAWKTLEANPEMGAFVRDFALTGKVPALPNRQQQVNGANETQADYDMMTDTERALAERLDRFEGMLDRFTKEVGVRVGRTERSFGLQSLQSNFETVATELGMNLVPEVFERVKGELASRVEKSGPEVYQSISGPDGRQSLRMLVMGVTKPEDWVSIHQAREIRRQKGLEDLSTGGPGIGVEPESMLDPSKFQGSAAEALRQARLHPERNPHS